MKLAKIVVLVAVAVLLTGGTALAESLQITIDKIENPTKDGPKVKITVKGNQNEDSGGHPTNIVENEVEVGGGITGKTKDKMKNKGMKVQDSGEIVISNPCAWVKIGGKWYWRCW
jgi:hypothetical protein